MVNFSYGYDLSNGFYYITPHLVRFKHFLNEQGHIRRQFIGFADKPTKTVIENVFKANKGTTATFQEWYSKVKMENSTSYYGGFPESTMRAGISKLVREKKIVAIKIPKSRIKQYRLA